MRADTQISPVFHGDEWTIALGGSSFRAVSLRAILIFEVPPTWQPNRCNVSTALPNFAALSSCSPSHAAPCAGEAGVTADPILFGQAAALEGPSSALGQGMRQGILAAFAEINAKGGVHGRKLELISRDDGYDPDRSVARPSS